LDELRSALVAVYSSNWRETLLPKGFWLTFWWRRVVDDARLAVVKAAA
jgi:hypothetical protein